jgi:glycerophosphoryl diester phosphodiesterase
MKPIIIAHKDNQTLHKEGVFRAFSSALALGADGIEFDVQVSKNGLPIIVHDYLYKENEKYPLLREVLERYRDKGRLEIEIKGYEKEGIETIVRELKKFNLPNYEVTSSEPPVCTLLAELLPKAERGLMMKNHMFEKWMPSKHVMRMIGGYLKLTKANVLHLDFKIYNSDLIEMLRKQGIKSHTLMEGISRKIARRIIGLGIDICSITDLNALPLFFINNSF